MNINNILMEKYLPVKNGIYFIAPVKNLKIDTKETDVVRSKDGVFLRNGNTYAPLFDNVVDHLRSVMQKHTSIVITFSYCHPEDFEIKDAFTVSMTQTECATTIGYYKVFREQILKESNKAVNEQ